MERFLANIPSIKFEVRQPSHAGVATAATLTTLSLGWLFWDYRAWVAFGTGGTPPTPSGYWRMTKIRWAKFRSGDDLRDWSGLSDEKPSYLSKSLPTREGKRPDIISRTMPQRQVPEEIPQDVRERLHHLPKKFCDAYPNLLILDKSKTEGGSTDAIYAKDDMPGRDARAVNRILGNEIAHVHPADNALHVWLCPVDAKEVVAKGWGERFPLSNMGIAPPGLVFIYSPRSMDEVDVVEEIIKAGIEFLTGFRI